MEMLSLSAQISFEGVRQKYYESTPKAAYSQELDFLGVKFHNCLWVRSDISLLDRSLWCAEVVGLDKFAARKIQFKWQNVW